jgi:hypothetical protein
MLVTKDQYVAYRHEVKSGDVLAWSYDSVYSKIIKWWTNSEYSHVGIALSYADRLFVIEALQGKGVVITPLSNKKEFYHFKTNADWDLIKDKAFKQVGKPYSFLDAVLAGLKLKLTSKGWQCAEFVNHVLSLSIEYPTPSNIVESVRN